MTVIQYDPLFELGCSYSVVKSTNLTTVLPCPCLPTLRSLRLVPNSPVKLLTACFYDLPLLQPLYKTSCRLQKVKQVPVPLLLHHLLQTAALPATMTWVWGKGEESKSHNVRVAQTLIFVENDDRWTWVVTNIATLKLKSNLLHRSLSKMSNALPFDADSDSAVGSQLVLQLRSGLERGSGHKFLSKPDPRWAYVFPSVASHSTTQDVDKNRQQVHHFVTEPHMNLNIISKP